MKCPKCGFNTFEYYDSCTKCSSDLKAYKQNYTITSLVIPGEGKQELAARLYSAEQRAERVIETAETHDNIFSFDLPEEVTPQVGAPYRNPLRFDEPASEGSLPIDQNKSGTDVFADLLESTAQMEKTVVSKTVTDDFSTGPGEFDFENFSWEDTPSPPPAPDSKKNDNDFDSFFSETGKVPDK